jgi:hypothetical protein
VRNDVVSPLATNERLKDISMPDYGHRLRFATFIGPTNSPPSRPVELAQLSERLGFDFVTFQDHPCQSSFLDTWTLLTWVAADRAHGRRGRCQHLHSGQRRPDVIERFAAETIPAVREHVARERT